MMCDIIVNLVMLMLLILGTKDSLYTIKHCSKPHFWSAMLSITFFFIGTVRKFILVGYTMYRPRSAADVHDTGCFIFCAFDCIVLPTLTLYLTFVESHDKQKCLQLLRRND